MPRGRLKRGLQEKEAADAGRESQQSEFTTRPLGPEDSHLPSRRQPVSGLIVTVPFGVDDGILR